MGDCIILDSPLLQQVTERRESVMLTGEEFRNGLPDNPCTEHIQEAFIVPMSNKDRVVGVAIIRESRPYHLHSADELWMCEALANQAAYRARTGYPVQQHPRARADQIGHHPAGLA